MAHVRVSVVKAGHQHLAVDLDDFGIRANERSNIRVGTDEHDLAVGNCDRLRPGPIVIDGIDSPTSKHRVRARRRRPAARR